MNEEFRQGIIQRLEQAVKCNNLVKVSRSWIPAAASGLFANKQIKKGQVLTCYVGEICITKDAIKRYDKSYLMRLGSNVYIDSLNCPLSLARYINDCRTPTGYNVTFLKSPSEFCAWVISTRDIAAGEELFVDYGRWYWTGSSLKATPLSYFQHSKHISSLPTL